MAFAQKNEFEVARERASAQNNAAVQGQKDAMKRRFAAQGSLNSGAAIKAEKLADDAGAQRLQDANMQINAAEGAENRRLKEVAEARDFAKSERLGSQDFAAGQADLGRKFQTSERVGGQEFASGEAGKQRAFAANESKLARNLETKKIKDAWDMGMKQIDLDTKVSDFNMEMARKEFDKKGMLEELFGSVSMGKLGGTFGGGKSITPWDKGMLNGIGSGGGGGSFGSMFSMGGGGGNGGGLGGLF